MVIALCVTWMARRLVNGRLLLTKLPVRDLAFAALILALFTPCLWVLAWALFSVGGHETPALLTAANYGAIFSAGLVLVLRGDSEPSPAVHGKSEQPRLVRRLPQDFQGLIYRLTVRDHNVDVVTSQGTFTIRSRFTDAINDMEPVAGHCSHRSHWVTDASIVRAEKSDGKTWLRLVNGDLVPVSRKYRPKLEEDGLI